MPWAFVFKKCWIFVGGSGGPASNCRSTTAAVTSKVGHSLCTYLAYLAYITSFAKPSSSSKKKKMENGVGGKYCHVHVHMPAPLGCHSSLYTAAAREIVWMNRVLFRLLCATALLAVAVGHLGRKNGDGGVPLVKRRVDKLERKLDNVDESVDALQDSHRQEMIALLNNRVDRLGKKLDDVHDSVNALQDDNDTETAAGEEARPSVNTVGRARLNGLPLLGPNRKQRENSAISMNTKASEIVINDGVRTSICSTGGGVRAMLSMWAILKKFGRSLVAQAPVIATSSGSSWFVNQLLSKKTF